MSDPAPTPRPTDGPDMSLDPTLKGLRSGQKVFGDRYMLIRILGRGGMGVVWLARDEELGQEVALKFLPEFVALDRASLDDLKEETKKTLGLTHPHIVRTYTFHSDPAAEMAAIAMEVVDGGTLTDARLDQAGRVFEVHDADFQKWIAQLCAALAYAHAKKRIVHRDLKPSNLMVTSEGDLKVTDFGIARSLNESVTRFSRKSHSSSVGGTLPYMSPQQALGQSATVSDDIYSLGASLYELLTGKPPFYAGEIFEQIKTQTPPPITERRAELNVQSVQPVPDAWERAVLACLAKKPEERPASVAALARLLHLEGDFPESAKLPGVVNPGPAFHAGARPGVQGAGSAPGHGSKLPGGKRWRATALQGLAALIIAGGCYWWFGMEKPKRDHATALVSEGRAAFQKDDRVAAQRKLTEALAVMPSHSGAEKLRAEMEVGLQEAIERALGSADAALARKDMFAAREAYAGVLALRADHPRASSGFAGLKDIVGGLEIKTSPAGAKVQVGGLESATSPCTLKALPLGKHRLTLTLEGYEPVTEEVTLHNDTFVPFDQKLLRQRGILKIESTPPGMEFTVKMTKSIIASEDEMKFTNTGKSPGVLENLPTGDYELKLTRDGWPEAVKTVSLTAAANETFAHDFSEGTLTLESTPPGQQAALLKPSGEVFAEGQTPLVVKAIPTGEGYKAKLTREGWPVFEQPVAIAKGNNPAITYDFVQGSVLLTAAPGEAEAEFLAPDGKKIASGKTPLTVKDQPVGPGYIAVLRRDGWPLHKIAVTLAKGANPAVNAEFAEGSLRIESTPPGCEFELRPLSEELDALTKELTEKETRYAMKGLGKEENAKLKARLAELKELIAKQEAALKPRTGRTPVDVTALPTGSHQVTLKREGWPDFVNMAQVGKGVNAPVTWEFGEGTIKLMSDPLGCEVWLGKRLLGKTPCNSKLPSGKNELRFKIGALGEMTKTVVIKSNETADMECVFKYGYLNLTTDPLGADIMLGTLEIGKTPLKRQRLPEGNITLILRKNGYEPHSFSVNVKSNQETTTQATLHKEPERLIFMDNYAAGVAKSRATGRPMLIAFHANWCGPCQTMVRNVYPDVRLKPFYGEFVWVKLDTDAKENSEISEKFGVEGIPHWSFVSPNGDNLGKLVGSCSVTEFINALEKHLNGN